MISRHRLLVMCAYIVRRTSNRRLTKSYRCEVVQLVRPKKHINKQVKITNGRLNRTIMKPRPSSCRISRPLFVSPERGQSGKYCTSLELSNGTPSTEEFSLDPR